MNEGELLTALREKLKNIEAPGETFTMLDAFTKGSTFTFQDLLIQSQTQTLMISRINDMITDIYLV